MNTYKIVLKRTGETMTGLDGSALVGLSSREATTIRAELETVWRRELGGDELAVVLEETPQCGDDGYCG